MFATEPIIVRLPAKVVASASTFHISSGSAKRVIHFPATSTNGTLEKCWNQPRRTTSGSKPELARALRRPVAGANKSHRASRYRSDHRQRQKAQRKRRVSANQPA